MNPFIKKSLIASSVAMALGSTTANAALMTDLYGAFDWYTDSANFTMLDKVGYVVGGTNDVSMSWDGNGYSSDTEQRQRDGLVHHGVLRSWSFLDGA